MLELPVTGLFETTIGTPAYMRMDALNRALRERPVASGAHLLIDRAREPALFRALKQVPAVSAVSLRRAAVDKFNETMAETMLIFIGFFAAFSCSLTRCRRSFSALSASRRCRAACTAASRADDFSARARRAIERLAAAHRDERVVAVTHGAFIGEVLRLATGARPMAFMAAENTSISHLVVIGDRWMLRRFNDTGHLDGGLSAESAPLA